MLLIICSFTSLSCVVVRSLPGEPAELLQKHIELVQSAPITCSELPEVRVGEYEPYKMTVLTTDPAGFVAAANAVPGFADDGIGVVVGGPYWVETVPLQTDKQAGVALVCAELGIPAERCVCVIFVFTCARAPRLTCGC